jgi:class 3 adenylate cyclase
MFCEWLQGAPVQGELATFVITDIQSSSKLMNSMPAAMSADQDRHDRLLRHLMLLYNGIEVATEGDSFHVRAFQSCCSNSL